MYSPDTTPTLPMSTMNPLKRRRHLKRKFSETLLNWAETHFLLSTFSISMTVSIRAGAIRARAGQAKPTREV